jgi:hypothetical protein
MRRHINIQGVKKSKKRIKMKKKNLEGDGTTTAEGELGSPWGQGRVTRRREVLKQAMAGFDQAPSHAQTISSYCQFLTCRYPVSSGGT